MLAGFLVVIAVLIAMYLFLKLLGVVFAGSSKKAAEQAALTKKPKAAAAVAAPVAVAASPNSHIVAIIAAAAHAVLGSRIRIVSVRPASAEWSAEGRRQIFASRQVR